MEVIKMLRYLHKIQMEIVELHAEFVSDGYLYEELM